MFAHAYSRVRVRLLVTLFVSQMWELASCSQLATLASKEVRGGPGG